MNGTVLRERRRMAKRHGSRVNPSRNRPVRNTILRLSDSVVTVRIVLTGGRFPALPAFPERFAPCLKTCLTCQSKRLPCRCASIQRPFQLSITTIDGGAGASTGEFIENLLVVAQHQILRTAHRRPPPWPSFVSRARYTSPIPPAPSARRCRTSQRVCRPGSCWKEREDSKPDQR